MVSHRFYSPELAQDSENLCFVAALKTKARAILRVRIEPEGQLIYQLLSAEISDSLEMQASLRSLHAFYVNECRILLQQRADRGEIQIRDVDFAADMLVFQIFSVINTCQVMKLDIPSGSKLLELSDLLMDMFDQSLETLNRSAAKFNEKAL
jgi:hypothetical protein